MLSNRFPELAFRVKRALRRKRVQSVADQKIFVMNDLEFFELDPADGLELKIAKAMRSFRSDKSTTHDYQIPYSFILSNVPIGPVLEIGLGTNNVDTPSNMGANGSPGASLRAWRQLGIFTEVWGADIDRRVLFTEPGIQTRFVDQLDLDAIAALASESKRFHPQGFSLIIDDGLHTAEANINTVTGLWDSLKSGGVLCIEDLNQNNLSEVLLHVKQSIPETNWAIWKNLSLSSDNQMLILKR